MATKTIDYFAIINKHIKPDSLVYRFYVPHVCLVTAKALKAGRNMGLSKERMRFIEEAAMLHDIGIITANAPKLGCYGKLPYICHGVEGRKILEAEGLPQHALVAERHTGVGLSKAEIIATKLPLPHRNMLAVSLEEEIISWADLFFGKKRLWLERQPGKIRKRLWELPDGEAKVKVFDDWMRRFSD